MSKIDEVTEELKRFEANIGYKFQDKKLLLLALSHSSYVNENKKYGISSNERLEFLGDSVLSVVISEFLYLSNQEMTEGGMSKTRACIVCEMSLAKVARSIELDKFVLLGRGEELTGGRGRDSILADAFEALLGAMFLDGGIQTVKAFILQRMKDVTLEAFGSTFLNDYKSRLQEKVQHDGILGIVYEIISEEGPDHDKQFIASVSIDGKIKGQGFGKTKKEAEQNAAKKALESI